MKRLLPALVAIVCCVAACSKLKYREKERPDPMDVLPTNVWEFEGHFSVDTDTGSAFYCRLPQYLVYNKDRTGFYTYAHPCDTTYNDTFRFTWSISPDKYYVRMIMEQRELVQCKFIICDYDMVRMECRSDKYVYSKGPLRMLDGNFKPKGN